MFENVGGKIKFLAKTMCWLGIVSFIFLGLALIYIGGTKEAPIMAIQGVIYLIFGPIVSWIGSWFFYGFGRLIENSEIIVDKMSTINSQEEYENEIELDELINQYTTNN